MVEEPCANFKNYRKQKTVNYENLAFFTNFLVSNKQAPIDMC